MELEGWHSSEIYSYIRRTTLMQTFLMLPMGGLHVKHAVQHGIWVWTQHLLWDQGKPWKMKLKSRYDWQSVRQSWRWAHYGTCDQILILCEICCFVSVGHPLWRDVGSVSLSATVSSNCPCVFVIFLSFFPHFTWNTFYVYTTYMQGLVSPGSVQQIMLYHL
jgi:hypothetical protein